MKKLLILSLVFYSSVYAQEVIELQKPLKCGEAQFVMNHFAKEYGEMPAWVGSTDTNTHITLLANKEKKTWTLVEYNDNLACVLGSGNSGSNTNNI
jgi:hypothetical protein